MNAFADAQRAVRGASELEPDVSFETFLARRRLPEETKTFARMMVEGFDAADPRRVSALSIVEEWGGGELGSSQQRPQGGYGALVGWLANSIIASGAQLRLGAVVNRVQWKRHVATVSGTFLGERFMTDARLRTSFRHTTVRPGAYSEEEIRILLEAVRDRTGPLNYYRAALRHPPRWKKIEAETLIIWGERDRWLGAELAEPDPRWVPQVRLERIADASHWVQADQPARVNELLLGFLR